MAVRRQMVKVCCKQSTPPVTVLLEMPTIAFALRKLFPLFCWVFVFLLTKCSNWQSHTNTSSSLRFCLLNVAARTLEPVINGTWQQRKTAISVPVPCNVARRGVVVKALRYKAAGRGFDSRWCHWNFSVT